MDQHDEQRVAVAERSAATGLSTLPQGCHTATRRALCAGVCTRPPSHHRTGGISLIEALIALAITAILLTATMVAVDASFKSYADAAEQASTQASTRMIVHRLMQWIRTGASHAPVGDSDIAASSYTPASVRTGDVITGGWIQFLDPLGQIIQVEYRPDAQQLWVIREPGELGEVAQPILGGVTDCTFTTRRRRDDRGVWVLERATIDMTIEADDDATLELENPDLPSFRVIASTMPRRLE